MLIVALFVLLIAVPLAVAAIGLILLRKRVRKGKPREAPAIEMLAKVSDKVVEMREEMNRPDVRSERKAVYMACVGGFHEYTDDSLREMTSADAQRAIYALGDILRLLEDVQQEVLHDKEAPPNAQLIAPQRAEA